MASFIFAVPGEFISKSLCYRVSKCLLESVPLNLPEIQIVSVATAVKCYMGFRKYLQDMFTVSVASKRHGSEPLNVFSFALVAGGD